MLWFLEVMFWLLIIGAWLVGIEIFFCDDACDVWLIIIYSEIGESSLKIISLLAMAISVLQ